MILAFRLLLLTFLVALSVAASGSAAAPTQTCQAAQLHARVLDSSGAAGTIAVSVTLTNAGAACTLRGYTGLRLRNAKGPLPTTVVRGGLAFLQKAVRTITLRPGGKASILIAYSHVPSGSSPCPTATRLLIRPPGSTGWVPLSLRLDPCRGGRIYESPVLARTVHVP